MFYSVIRDCFQRLVLSFPSLQQTSAFERYLIMWVRSSLIFCLVVILVSPNETLFASGIAQKDDDWSYIGTSKEDIKLYYSPDRTTEHGSLIQAWFKAVDPDSDKKISYSISLHEFNCRKGTYRLLQGTLYFRDGSARSSNEPSPWEYPLPGSLAEMEFRQICRPTSRRRKNVRAFRIPGYLPTLISFRLRPPVFVFAV